MPNTSDLDFDSAAAQVVGQDNQAAAIRIRNNVQWAVGTNPDQAARYQHLAKYLTMPPESVAADPLEAERQAAQKQMDAGRIVSDYPHLARYLDNPYNTDKSHDDIPQLAGVEQASRALPPVPAGQAAPQFDGPHFSAWQAPTPSIRDRLTDWWASVTGGPTAEQQRQAQGAAEATAILAARASNPALVPPPNATPAQVKALNDQAWEQSRNAVGGMSQVPQIAAQRFLDAASLGVLAPSTPITPHSWQASTAGGAGTLAGFIAGPGRVASTLLSKIPGASVLQPVTGEAFTTQFAKTVVQQAANLALANMAQESGHALLDSHSAADAGQAMAHAGLTGAETGALFGAAGKVLPDNTAAQWAARALGVSLGQDFIDGTNPLDDRPLEDKVFSYALNALFTAHGGGRSDGNWFTSNPEVQERFANIEKATDAIRTGQALAELSGAASQAKTRERDAAGFKAWLDSAIDDTQVKEVYIRAADLENALQQSGVPPEQIVKTLPDLVDQLHEAVQTDGDVRIPVADYMAHIAGSKMDQAMLPHLKAYPDGMTAAEGHAYYEQQKAGMVDQAKKMLDDQVGVEQSQQEAQAIHDNILDQLEAVGRFRPEVNKAYASMVRDFYTTQAERNGMTPREMYERYPLTASESPDALAQGPRGNYSPDTRTIGLLKDADLSTFLHESGHFFLEVMHDLANRPDAPAQLLADRDTLLKWQGIDSPETWNSMTLDQKRDAHEQFARGFEAYLMEGKAPSMEMQGLFSRFRSWLVNIYKSLSTLNVHLSDEVRQVMDRMLASDEAIKQAQQTRSYLAMDKVPEGTDPKLLADYHALDAQATQDAQADMTARSLRDMRWLSNAKGKAMRELQGEAKAQRDAIREEVTKEVMDTPVRQAEAYLKRPDNTDPVPLAEQKAWENQRAAKLAEFNDQVKAELFADNPDATGIKKGQLLAKNKRALANEAERRTLEWEKENPRPTKAKTEPYPDFIAEMFGFADGKALKAAIKEAGPLKDQIDALTDQRMLERHGDLVDPVSIERAAEAAIHNDARARFMATGLKMLSKSPMPARQLAKAAKEAADTAIAAKQVKDLRPAQYSAAEARSNKDVIKLSPKDPAGAVAAQRAALLNNRLFKSASDAVADVQKGLDYFKKFSKDSIRGKIDVDIRDQIDDLLARFDLRKNPTDQPTREQVNLQNWVEAQIAAGYTPAVTPDMLRPEVRMPYAEMTVEQFRGLVDSVKSLEHIGRERKTATVDGQRVLVDDYVKSELVPKIREKGVNFTPDQLLDRAEDRTSNPVALALDKLQSWLRMAAAELKPQEFKRNQYDRHEILGPFGKAIFDPIIEANYRKIDMLKGLSTDFETMAKELGRDWQDSLREKIDNKTLLDPDKSTEGKPVAMNFTRGKMIGLALHVGNESNFDKLTRGWGWQGADVWKFLHDNMTAKDWRAVQAVWDLYEKHWPDVEAMNRRLGNTTPDKIEPRPFNTPFGEMRGGYAAITYDPLRSRRGERVQAGEAINPSEGLFGRGYFRADSTTNGSLNARMSNYIDRVDLDFHGIPRKLNETIHDLAYREALIDANKFIQHPEFKKAFRQAYGPEAYKSMQEWLGNLANAQNADNAVGALGKFLQYTRTGMVINAIAFRATTVLKHGGSAGIKTLGYFAGGGEKYLASRMAAMAYDYRNQIASAQEKFPEIRARLMQQDRDFRSLSHSLFEPEKPIAQAERFGHAAVAWSDMMTAVPTAWAAYDRAITEGIPASQGGTGQPMTEAQAVAYANKVVREAHGSQIEASRSMLMNERNEGVKMFTTLYGFMNTTYGQMLDGFDKLRTDGISSAPVLARTFMALIVPALWAGYLSHGSPQDKSGEGWAAWAGKAIAGEVAGTVPLVRDAVAMFEGYKNAGLVGVENWVSTMVQAVNDVRQGNGKQIRDIANAIGMGLHIPGMGQLGTSAQYLEDVHSGKEHPADNWELAKGVATGHGEKH